MKTEAITWVIQITDFKKVIFQFYMTSLMAEKVSHSVVTDSLRPNGPQPTRLLCPWDSPGKNTGAGSHSLLQGMFPTQDQTWVSCIEGGFFTVWTTREVSMTGRGKSEFVWYYLKNVSVIYHYECLCNWMFLLFQTCLSTLEIHHGIWM